MRGDFRAEKMSLQEEFERQQRLSEFRCMVLCLICPPPAGCLLPIVFLAPFDNSGRSQKPRIMFQCSVSGPRRNKILKATWRDLRTTELQNAGDLFSRRRIMAHLIALLAP